MTLRSEDVGWRCGKCGWRTFSLQEMHESVNWPNPDKTISLVCPNCGAEGQFVDAYRVEACPTCQGTRLQMAGWMGPTPIRRYPDACSDCSPELAGRELQAAYVAYVTEPGRFDAEGQARMLLEPKPAPAAGTPTGEKRHGVYCNPCDSRTTFIVFEGGVAACESCGFVTLDQLGASS